MKGILKLNEISPVADKVFDSSYDYSKTAENPIGIILRSYKMHDYPLNDELLAVARAGAGVNNIPIDKCSEKGVVVFNTPGANANAVKELVLCALLMSSRKIAKGYEYAQSLKGKGAEVGKLVESGKNAFVGPELHDKKIAIVGLGAIGAYVANACVSLGMEVYGYDPYISIDAAWRLSRAVKHVTDFNELISNCDYLSLHIPLTPKTKHLIDSAAISRMKHGVRIVNCARGELVDNEAILKAIEDGQVASYFTDFPTDELLGVDGITPLPHLGASTPEAEDNCALAAAKQLKDFIENGNITNSVNFPSLSQTRHGVMRICVIHKNVKNILSNITSLLANDNVNISNLLNSSKGDYAYTIVDCDTEAGKEIKEEIETIEGVIKARIIK